jgi:hypothetical protein
MDGTAPFYASHLNMFGLIIFTCLFINSIEWLYFQWALWYDRYRIFYLKGCFNWTIYASFDDISIKRQTSFFFNFCLLGRCHRTVLQQMLNMTTVTFKTSISHFQYATCDYAKCFWLSDANSLFTVVFHFLQASCVIRINFFFEMS